MLYNTNKLQGYEYSWFRRPLLHIVVCGVLWCGVDRKKKISTLRVMKGGWAMAVVKEECVSLLEVGGEGERNPQKGG